MSTNEAAAVAAPGSVAAPAAPVTEVGTEAGSASAAKEQLFGRFLVTDTVEDAKSALDLPPRSEDGRFTTTEETAATKAPDAVVESPPAGVAAPVTPAAPAPGEMVMIELPQGHPLRDRGYESVPAPKEHEDYFRWAVQNAVRREQVVEWQTYANSWKDRAVRAEARSQALEQVGETVMLDPKTAHMIADIQNTYGPEAAEAFKRGLINDKVEGKTGELLTAAQEKEATDNSHAVAAQFTDQAFNYARQAFPLFTEREFDAALSSYGTLMEVHGVEMPDLDAFAKHAQALYLQKPNVRASLQAQIDANRATETERTRLAERERIANEEKERLAEARKRRGEIPLAGVPSVLATDATLGASTGPKTAADAKQSLFNRRGVARA